MFDFAWDVLKVLAGAGIGWVGGLVVATLKSTGLVKKLRLESLLEQVAERVVAYVQDLAKESGATGAEQREQAVKSVAEQTGISVQEAEERVRAAYVKMKQSGG